ncbi:protein rep [Acinetobacter sp. YH12058]|uniref:protein rep n=1 Tax=Acinetobacter sp. YH12058 TaxID=2601058 RepID=UPI0015D0D241|nr:protein rep [Acinetobacter sp. YH12058]
MHQEVNTQKSISSNRSVLTHSKVTPAKKSDPLGKHTESYSADSINSDKKQHYKKARYKTLSVIQKILSQCAGKWRVTGCGIKRIDKLQNVFVTYDKQNRSASYRNVQVCGNTWLCPVCSERIAHERKQEIERLIVLMHKRNLKAHMLTLTTPHYLTDDLKDLLEKQALTKKYFFGDRKSKAFWENEFPHLGHITSTEVKYSDNNGWHPHYHLIVVTEEGYSEKELKKKETAIYELWADCCVRAGLKRPSRKHGVDLKRGYDDDELNNPESLINYALKGSLANELTMSHCKTGRFNRDSLTPFEIALLAENEKDFEHESSKYSNLFYQYAVAFKGKKQSFINKSLKDLIRKIEEEEKAKEQDDKSEPEKQDEPTVVYELIPIEWRALCSDVNGRGDFLVAIEKDIEELGIDTNKFPRADSVLNRILGGQGGGFPIAHGII